MKPLSSIAYEGVLIFNDKNNIILAGPFASQVLGYGIGEMVGVSVNKVFKNGLSLIQEYQSEIQVRKNTAHADEWIEMTGFTKKGDTLPLKVSLNQFRLEHQLLVVALIAEAMPALKKPKKPASIDRSPVIFLILDKEGNISLINKLGCDFLACAKETILGLNWFDHFLPPENVARVQSIFKQAFDTGVVQQYESQMLSLSGENCTVRWSTYIIYNSLGEPIGTFNIGVEKGKKKRAESEAHHIARIGKINKQLEINAKKQNQELVGLLTNVEKINRDLQIQIKKRKVTEQKLITFQRLYDTMVHNFPDGVIGILNKKMEYVLIDGKELNEIDLPALGLTSQTASFGHDPVLAEETVSKIKKAFDGENVSFEVNTKDKSYSITAVPLPDAKNRVNEILCVLKNITEKSRMEAALLKTLEKEKELGELKSRFITMACHEFKTPLATILSSTFLLENYSGEEYDNEKLLHSNRIRRSVNNLNTILNEFLLIERHEEDPVELKLAPLHIPTFIGEVLSEVESLKKRGQVIEYRHSGKQETVESDQHLLWSIVTNLISNALKYSGQESIVEVTTATKKGFLVITVKDNGIGIPAREQEFIFDRFHRAPNAMNYDGTGLGLHIVRKNVKLLNGNVSLTSEENRGTEFTVLIPYQKKESVTLME